MEYHYKRISHMTFNNRHHHHHNHHYRYRISSLDASNYLSSINKEAKSLLIKKFKYLFNLNLIKTASEQSTPSPIAFNENGNQNVDVSLIGNYKNLTLFTINKNQYLHNSQDSLIHFLNYYYQNNYSQNLIYYNNLILAAIILFILFSVLVLLEENENSSYNLSAIAFLLLVTFNLILIILSHNLTKQFIVNKTYF
jgi:hypothetical protein